ncbi:NAD(P) transhydrogenase subunit beta [Mariniphaga anaerophila]|uniref:NAD(P) transhydrogenase subunit beta n=1 Tax=Mariniphaga anaerophila TaxID=1484053 RepID=A0A1M4SP36_9BACT|nr:NAD(P)(+) transhydrogenase (Re/Si-specific) subunit beta [Mariniphaga anaerophila]SHE33929.1 NAD(P) transhydrogenase subunit beta [Mariniphaga anaerophila]
MDKVLGIVNGTEFTIGDTLLELSYLVAALLFVFGLKLLSHPKTARNGNLWAFGGMALAMLTTLLLHKNPEGEGISLANIWIIMAAIGVGAVIGWIIARRVKMTAMPQLVSFYNATGGAASALVALLEYPNAVAGDVGSILVTVLGLIIGAVAFSGSMIAYGKLDGKVGDLMKPFMTYLNLFLMVLTLGLGIYIVVSPNPPSEMIWAIYSLLVLSLIYGVMFVLPIGGADMPVVISLLNSFTGIAAAMAGFIYNNQAMILGGILVGAAGTILTVLMCKAMNRSLINVIIGSFGGGASAAGGEQGTIKEITLSDAAVLMSYSQRIVIIPGYGLAVAQAQHIAQELDQLLESKGVDVKYAIHPVAGRMPGHMNVLLAEADVPYEKLVEMDDINPDMPNVDVAIVVGANDVVNPAAYDDPGSPIYGMPIIDAHLAKNIIIMKRGMGKGYAGIENKLFFNEKTRMLFGDAKSSIQKLVAEIKTM